MRLKIFRLLVHVFVTEFGIKILVATGDDANHIKPHPAKNGEDHHQQREDGVARRIATALDHRDAASGTSKVEKVHNNFRG
jgi:hypothetical protein